MGNTISRILSDETLNRIIQIESAGNPNARASTSSAAGLGQFITATWIDTVQKHKPALLKTNTREQVTAMRVGIGTADLQLEMLARFTEDNAAALGKGYTDGDLYLAHFLGIGDARRLFRAPPGDLASNHVSEAAVKANSSILRGKTCAQVRAWAEKSMRDRWDHAGRHDWVKKYAGVQVMPPDVPKPKPPAAPKPVSTPQQTKAKGGILAVLAAAAAWILGTIEQHPVIIGGGVFVLALMVAGWFLLRKPKEN